MHRRDFLLLRQPSAPRIVQISCERLHMAYLDLQPASAVSAAEDFSFAEPPSVIAPRHVDEWFVDLERDLEGVEVIQLIGQEWLHPDSLRVHVEALLAKLSRRGVRIDRRATG